MQGCMYSTQEYPATTQVAAFQTAVNISFIVNYLQPCCLFK